ncbi:hypothetical protein BDV30DRAFT_211222 [Aspergillus minisclerotigenes]|uniref:Uncharacterized protein n=1 Tax=Aspergillus minisclerotigenes TaxID=656917 RepID=A0A5N6J4D5_9EURO|nr:hypothetical protein BDV30DRAFT_211222 [Aspergillus minisclerotigenes]
MVCLELRRADTAYGAQWNKSKRLPSDFNYLDQSWSCFNNVTPHLILKDKRLVKPTVHEIFATFTGIAC